MTDLAMHSPLMNEARSTSDPLSSLPLEAHKTYVPLVPNGLVFRERYLNTRHVIHSEVKAVAGVYMMHRALHTYQARRDYLGPRCA